MASVNRRDEDHLVFASAKPNVGELIAEFSRCSPVSQNWNRFNSNEDIRYCRWPGQSADGKKWDKYMPEGESAFPFEGASDSRTFTIDETINEMVAAEVTAFWRALVRVNASRGDGENVEAAAYATKLLQWIMGTRQYRELVREVELHAQYTHTYGWSVLYITWRQERALRMVRQTMEEIVAVAQRAAEGGNENPGWLASLPTLIMEEEQEDALVEMLTSAVVGLNRKRARAAIRDLRRTGEAHVPMAYTVRDEPSIRALKPWEEVVIPNDCIDIQQARVVFVKEWVTEVELRSRIATDGYDKGFVEEAAKRKGQFTGWTTPAAAGYSGMRGSASGVSLISFEPDVEHKLIELVHGYVRMVDEDNVQGIYVTTFHPGIKPGPHEAGWYAKHELLEYSHGRMPFVVRKREHVARTITSSRGLPEIFHTTQRSIKVQEDAVTDWTSLGVMPPIIVPMLQGVDYRFAPGQQLPLPAAHLGTNREPHFMTMPGAGTKIAFEIMDRLERRIDRYAGRVRADEPEQGAQIKMQMTIQNSLISWTEALQQEFALLEQYLPEDDWARITGGGKPERNPQAISRQYDFTMTYDVREFSTEFIQAKLALIKDMILPLDAAGVIDRAKLVALLMRSVDPTLAGELVADREHARQAVFNQVKGDLVGILNGFEAPYTEGDPTAGMQLQFLQQLVRSNPKVMESAQRDERVRDHLLNYEKNRMQSVVQEQNKVVGALGVKPETMPVA